MLKKIIMYLFSLFINVFIREFDIEFARTITGTS